MTKYESTLINAAAGLSDFIDTETDYLNLSESDLAVIESALQVLENLKANLR